MAFGGSAGAAGAITAALTGPFGTLAIQADGTARISGFSGVLVGGAPSGCPQTIVPSFVTSGSPVLAAWIGQSIDGSTADAGVLATAAPGVDQHGLPTNFGPGRGNWRSSDLLRLRVEIRAFQLTTFSADAGQPIVAVLQLVSSPGPSDVLIAIKNLSSQTVSFLQLLLRYDHTTVL